MTPTTAGLCPSPSSNTCEATICNVEHEFELPTLVFLLPLFVFLFVSILLCFNGLLLLRFGVICGKTDPHSFMHLKGTTKGPLSASSGDPEERGNTSPHPPGMLSRQTSSPLAPPGQAGLAPGPGAPCAPSQGPWGRGESTVRSAAYVQGRQSRFRSLSRERLLQNIPGPRGT